jgi:hypothetical protein
MENRDCLVTRLAVDDFSGMKTCRLFALDAKRAVVARIV